MRTFIGKAAAVAAAVGSVFVVVLAAFGFSMVSAFHADDAAISTYADELILGRSLEAAVQRKLAHGRAYLLAREAASRAAFDRADADARGIFAELRARVTSQAGRQRLALAERQFQAHDQALRAVMAMDGDPAAIARAWGTEVAPVAARLRHELDTFIAHKLTLYRQAKTAAFRVQRRAFLISISTTVVAVLAGALTALALMRSASSAYAAEALGRVAAERERAFFTALLNQLPIGIFAADAPSGRLRLVSDQAQSLLAGEDPRAILGQTVAEHARWPVYRADGTPYADQERPLARAVQGVVIQREELYSDRERVYEVTAGPIRDQEGAIVAAVAAFSDATERKAAEKERELFIGALAHDLRNPVSAIALTIDMMRRRSDLPTAVQTKLERIAGSVQRMDRLIGELLDFSRGRHSSIPIHPQPCSLSSIAGEVLTEIRSVYPGREVTVTPEGGCEGCWDHDRIAQVFQNLIVNALEHGSTGYPVDVVTGRQGDTVWATVQNHGGTIPDGDQRQLFEPFKKTRTSKGLGLGLYISRAIVDAHGGQISVDSRAGVTTFKVELPGARRPPGCADPQAMA
jgi:PAS domain S-box-containing protein